MKKIYIIPVTETTRIETQNMNMLSNVENDSKTSLEEGYAPEGVSGLAQGNNLWDDDKDEGLDNGLPK